mgnify:CR=1 FL=1
MRGQGIRARHNYLGVTVLHLTRRELYRMNPGLFYDSVTRNKEEDL